VIEFSIVKSEPLGGYWVQSGSEAEQFEGLALKGCELGDLVEGFGGGEARLHAALGEGGEGFEESAEAVDGQPVRGALGVRLVEGAQGELGRGDDGDSLGFGLGLV